MKMNKKYIKQIISCDRRVSELCGFAGQILTSLRSGLRHILLSLLGFQHIFPPFGLENILYAGNVVHNSILGGRGQ
jgi:hypothetical protein